MNFGSNAYLTKYLYEFKDEHPLIVLFDLNKEYMTYCNDLLNQLDTVLNLDSKIKQLKDPNNWESTISELEFALELKKMGLSPEFVQKTKSASTDIKIDILDKEIHFEVKRLAETDQATRVYSEIWAIPSDFTVEIVHEVLNREEADELITYISNKINDAQIGSFEIDGNEIRIQKKKISRSPRTSVIRRTKQAITIPLAPLRRKIFMDFYDKIPQFLCEKTVFWVIDCQRWKYGEDIFRSVMYGTTVSDITVGSRHYVGFDHILKKYAENPELFKNTDIVPTFTYPNKNGLYFLDDASCLKGTLIKSYNRIHFLLNPFAEPQIDIAVIRKLRDYFP